MAELRAVCAALPDRRTGKNLSSTMADFAWSAFAVFFTQSPSFLAHQRALQTTRGHPNAQSFFEIEAIPCDPQIRPVLDPVPPESLYPMDDRIDEARREHGILERFRGVQDSTLIALDGTGSFSSQKMHCPHCSRLEHPSGEVSYYHRAVTPVRVAPGQPAVIALRPQFITPQDGHRKQDGELAAAQRWLEANATRYRDGAVTLLGDDLYAHQPFCRRALLHSFHSLFVCQPESHATLDQWVHLLQPGPDLGTCQPRVKVGGQWHPSPCRWAHHVPLAAGEDALKVDGCEVTVTDPDGKVLYHPAWITDWPITEKNVAALVTSGRARWQIENEHNHPLKTKGYPLEHNFGHGQEHLSSLLATMNLLAFLCHTVLGFSDAHSRLVRAALPSRQTFCQHVSALTHDRHFPSWGGAVALQAARAGTGALRQRPLSPTLLPGAVWPDATIRGVRSRLPGGGLPPPRSSRPKLRGEEPRSRPRAAAASPGRP